MKNARPEAHPTSTIMKQTQHSSTAAVATLSDLSRSDKHCIFRSGPTWFSVPAISVREIAIAPEIVPVPNCHPALTGLCHLRSEFIPVLQLNALLEHDSPRATESQNKLLVINGHSPWSFLIAEAAALQSSETLIAPDGRGDDASQTAMMGTAMYRGQIVRVLDPTRLFRLAQRTLEGFWASRKASPLQSLGKTGSLS